MRWPSSRTTWEPEEILAYPARLLLSLQSFHILLLMADDLSRWKSATLHRIEGMQAFHRQQCARVEAGIESKPFQANFSKTLVGLMRREEEILAKGSGDATDLALRIEDLLASETRRLFQVQAQRSAERWTALFEAQRNQRQLLSRQVQSELARFHAGEEALPEYTHPEAAATSREPEEHHRSSRRNSCDRQYDFKANEDAMRAASAARWGKDERLCLESAFSLQLKRLEVDWETHDVKVDAEYNMRRAAVEARLVPGSGDRLGSTGAGAAKRDDYANGGQTFSPSLTRKSDERGLASGSDVTTTPWRGREKQSRLIHTAPVFQPEVDKSARRHMWETVGGTNRAGGRKRDTAAAYWATGAQRELDRLNAAFSAVKGRMATQKLAAQKWIRRQRIRMEAQIEATEAVIQQKQKRARAADREENDLLAMVTSARHSSANSEAPTAGTPVVGDTDGASHALTPSPTEAKTPRYSFQNYVQ